MFLSYGEVSKYIAFTSLFLFCNLFSMKSHPKKEKKEIKLFVKSCIENCKKRIYKKHQEELQKRRVQLKKIFRKIEQKFNLRILGGDVLEGKKNLFNGSSAYIYFGMGEVVAYKDPKAKKLIYAKIYSFKKYMTEYGIRTLYKLIVRLYSLSCSYFTVVNNVDSSGIFKIVEL
ncbi:hypothetical protein ACFLYU_02660 [Candidatus Dependentiae bacterium]